MEPSLQKTFLMKEKVASCFVTSVADGAVFQKSVSACGKGDLGDVI